MRFMNESSKWFTCYFRFLSVRLQRNAGSSGEWVEYAGGPAGPFIGHGATLATGISAEAENSKRLATIQQS
jgi:hypothetical protein